MKNLFHSVKEKITFWVTGYDYPSDNVNENIEYLKGNTKKFSNETGIPQDKVKSYVIPKSRRYKYMRVFYADSEKEQKNAFEIGKDSDWTMWKWLKD